MIFCKAVGESVTAGGRNLIKKIESYINQQHNNTDVTLMIDTDSVMFRSDIIKTSQDADVFVNKINTYLKQDASHFTVELDALSTTGNLIVIGRKNYVIQTSDKTKVRGIVYSRMTEHVKSLYKTYVNDMLNTLQTSDIFNYVRQQQE